MNSFFFILFKGQSHVKTRKIKKRMSLAGFRHKVQSILPKPSYTPRITLLNLVEKGFLHPGPNTIALKGTEKAIPPNLHTLTKEGTIVVNLPNDGGSKEFKTPSAFARFFIDSKCNGWQNTLYRPPITENSIVEKWQKLDCIRKKFNVNSKLLSDSEPSSSSTISSESGVREKNGIIYMFHTRACINANESIYKIGKTRQPLMNRLRQYTKGTTIEGGVPVPDHLLDSVETHVLRTLRQTFDQKKDYGYEYFEGDRLDIFQCLCRTIEAFLEREQTTQKKLTSTKKKYWVSLCGKIEDTRQQVVRKLYKVVFPVMNDWFVVHRNGTITEKYPDGSTVTRTIDDTLSLHRNRWIAWKAPHLLPKDKRIEVLREWMSWEKRIDSFSKF